MFLIVYNDILKTGFHLSDRELFNLIMNCNDIAGLCISELAKYGMYDMIIPLLEKVLSDSPSNVRKWISKIICCLPDSNFVKKTLDNYHQTISDRYQFYKQHFGEKFDDNYLRKVFIKDSPVGTSKTVWECYDDEQMLVVCKNYDRNIGLWTPGLYSSKHDFDYLENLQIYAWPCLKSAFIEISKHPDSSRILKSIVEFQLHRIIAEISIHYFAIFERGSFELRKLRFDYIESFSGKEIRDSLYGDISPKDKLYLYYNEKWVDFLIELCEYAKRYSTEDLSGYIESMESYIPHLLQLIDKNDKAEKLLISSFRKSAIKYDTIYLISCSIALLKPVNMKSWSRLYYLIKDAYDCSEYVDEYIMLIDDTVAFFSAYFDSLKQEYETESFKMIHSLAVSSTKDWNKDDWIYEYLIKDNLFVVKMNEYKNEIKRAKNPLIEADDAFEKSLILFYDFSVDLENYPRISFYSRLPSALGLSDKDCLFNEIGYKKQYHQADRHLALWKRYKKIQYKMPSASFLKWTTELLNRRST